MMPSPVEILYEDGPYLAVLKPSGLLTQAPPGIDSMELRLKTFLKERDNKPGNVYLGVPHRLDRPVSGAMVFGRHTRATRRLAKQFEKREIVKVYWALVAAVVRPEAGTWEDWIRKIPNQARSEIVDRDHPEGRIAILHYRTLGAFEGGSWLEIQLETGRTHQIRVQAASRGYAILGDRYYGSEVAFGVQYEDERRRAIGLHGRSLTFRHPQTREMISVTAPTSEEWSAYRAGSGPRV